MQEPTGRNDGLLQDYSRGLASRPDARYVVRQVCREIELQRTTGTHMTTDTQKLADLLPCPFCGGPVQLEEANRSYTKEFGERRWWGVTCRNTTNLGGTCCMDQVPSASIQAAVKRWNMRNGILNPPQK